MFHLLLGIPWSQHAFSCMRYDWKIKSFAMVNSVMCNTVNNMRGGLPMVQSDPALQTNSIHYVETSRKKERIIDILTEFWLVFTTLKFETVFWYWNSIIYSKWEIMFQLRKLLCILAASERHLLITIYTCRIHILIFCILQAKCGTNKK